MLDYKFKNKVYKNEFSSRVGLYNTISKLLSGDDVTVAYIGGSITQGNTWSSSVTKWLEDEYTSNIVEVNIGLAGTGADLAACRIDDEALVHNPDIVFIEYAVNGGTESNMEGMVRKIWRHNPATDICFVYTSLVDDYSIYANGEVPIFASAFESVAEYYRIPSVFFIKQAFDLYEKGKLVLSGTSTDGDKIIYTTDGVHLTADGGRLSAGAVARMIVSQKKIFDKNSYRMENHTVPDRLMAQPSWENATCTDDFEKMKFEGAWFDCPLKNNSFENFEYKDGLLYIFKKLFLNLRGTKAAGSSVTVKFTGTDLGILEAGGQYSGQLIVTIDGKVQKNKLILYNKSSDEKLRHQYYFIDTLPYGEHTVKFTLDPEMPDKSALCKKNPGDSLYAHNELYIGRILCNGKIEDANK